MSRRGAFKFESVRLCGSADDFPEASALQAGSPHERTIDVRLAHEFRHVVGLDAAAVLNADAAGGGGIVEIGEDRTDHGVGFLGLLSAGSATGANGPNGFVGDHGANGLLSGDIGEAAGELGG